MAKVESKTRTVIDMEVIGTDGKKKGHLQFTGGNIHYYRVKGKKPAATYTYQQLIELIEDDIEEN